MENAPNNPTNFCSRLRGISAGHFPVRLHGATARACGLVLRLNDSTAVTSLSVVQLNDSTARLNRTTAPKYRLGLRLSRSTAMENQSAVRLIDSTAIRELFFLLGMNNEYMGKRAGRPNMFYKSEGAEGRCTTGTLKGYEANWG